MGESDTSFLSNPLEKAVDMGQMDLVIQFVEALKRTDRTIDQVSDIGLPILRRAVGCPRVLEFLLANGADPLRESVERQTALHMACRKRKVEACEILIRVMQRANGSISTPDLHGEMTPLQLAAALDYTGSMCRQLVEAGADLLALDSNACSPMDIAVMAANKRV